MVIGAPSLLEAGTKTDLRDIPIPMIRPVSGWKDLPIEECGEKLVALNHLNPYLLVVDAQYHRNGIESASPIQYVRASVAERLLGAARLLPSGHKLLVWDAWRPLEVQSALFGSYFARLKGEYPNLSYQELKNLTQTYVSLPSADALKPSPHYTGGAIDLSVLDTHGEPLEMGTTHDHFGPESATRFFEEHFTLTDPMSNLARINRRLLYHAMSSTGFSVYDEEWWHFDFGNQFDAVRSGRKAIYGPSSL